MTQSLISAPTTLQTCLLEQFDRFWVPLREAISLFNDQQWRNCEIAYLVPCSLAMHLIETVEFYIQDAPKDFPWGRFGGDWDHNAPHKWPSQPQMLEYLEQVRTACRQWIETNSDAVLLAPQAACPWTGQTLLDRMIYTLRHSQHHLGQLNVELRRHNLPRAKWA